MQSPGVIGSYPNPNTIKTVCIYAPKKIGCYDVKFKNLRRSLRKYLRKGYWVKISTLGGWVHLNPQQIQQLLAKGEVQATEWSGNAKATVTIKLPSEKEVSG